MSVKTILVIAGLLLILSSMEVSLLDFLGGLI